MLQWSQDSLLRFHPDKCVWMRIGKSPQDQDNPPTQVYVIDNKYLAHSSDEKDLGVFIDTDLKFDKHIASKVSKAIQIAGLIRRSFEHLDCDTFNVLFTTLARHLEYAQSVWSPYLKKHINAIEKVQRRVLKRVPELSSLSYEDRLRQLNLRPLAYRRYRGDMIEMYKLTHCLYDSQVTDEFLDMDDKKVNTRGHPFKLNKQGCKLNLMLHSIRYRTVDQWNNLPLNVVQSGSIACFERRLNKLWNGTVVMYDPDIDVRQITKSKKDIRCCAHTQSDEDNHDLTTEAHQGLFLSEEDYIYIYICKTM